MNVPTFKPLKQQVNSDDKYTDLGYIPCNGYVPCKVMQKPRFILKLPDVEMLTNIHNY